MAQRIIWSTNARADLKEILDYWKNRNKSSRYSKKLYSQIKELVSILANYPQLGRATKEDPVRVQIFKNYKIFYSAGSQSIEILRIWDSRNPEQLKF